MQSPSHGGKPRRLMHTGEMLGLSVPGVTCWVSSSATVRTIANAAAWNRHVQLHSEVFFESILFGSQFKKQVVIHIWFWCLSLYKKYFHIYFILSSNQTVGHFRSSCTKEEECGRENCLNSRSHGRRQGRISRPQVLVLGPLVVPGTGG